ncbi:hypothetical protein [Lonepinella koalarum]|uniref:Uncharacterized protein n=1 Tax=Lonepinella koalarum TaxID=53417 RepID=A0A4R1KQ09_9PAST|nr:hypothetical protein [Lonepinella koalarum]MDH2925707.1 hypothetical protein [Lonepinella koalarum]TCK67094.1 hypothetical protein EV692_2000 [Lonepinella koalarum]TFJ88916.1 hypothetical protein E0709_11300 [Lonepinella koalarum]
MLFQKEKGYDEFLAEQIKQAREDIQAGKVLTLAESKARTQALLERKARELEQTQQGTIYA